MVENKVTAKVQDGGYKTPVQLKEIQERPSKMAKEENIAFRTSPEIKQILERLAKEGYRSLSQQCEMIIVEWLRANGYTEKQEPSLKTPHKRDETPSHMVQDAPAKYGRKRGK